ncbi:unnamed protein product [Owenia fusiformis]|uniref:Uncharacterized protein n=1 Tax=Owenia fusiformis TaxID=6347 RepID=A0A8J1UR79_OWEFU|nr:unnamed protein product [Owenia fusiformis]
MSSKDRLLLFAESPTLTKLWKLTVCLPKDFVCTGVIYKCSPQIIKCRELIFTEPDIIATPDLNYEKKLLIILTQTMYKSGKLQARLNKMGFKVEKPCPVSPADYQSCLNYTMLAKLAPNWNKVGETLINGRNFLCNSDKMNAIHLELTLQHKELFVAITAKTVKLFPAKLEDLDIAIDVRREFTMNKEAIITEDNIHNCWCYVLPSMKRGRVSRILHQLPTDGPFRTYKDLKRHWKNNYGYRLPDSDEGMLYFQIFFGFNGGSYLTYPGCCIRTRNMLTFPRTNPQPIIADFLSDLRSKLPSVCGEKLLFNPKPQYPQATLLEASDAESCKKTLLTELPPHGTAIGYRPTTTTPMAPVFKAKPPLGAQSLPPGNVSTMSHSINTQRPNHGNTPMETSPNIPVGENRPIDSTHHSFNGSKTKITGGIPRPSNFDQQESNPGITNQETPSSSFGQSKTGNVGYQPSQNRLDVTQSEQIKKELSASHSAAQNIQRRLSFGQTHSQQSFNQKAQVLNKIIPVFKNKKKIAAPVFKAKESTSQDTTKRPVFLSKNKPGSSTLPPSHSSGGNTKIPASMQLDYFQTDNGRHIPPKNSVHAKVDASDKTTPKVYTQGTQVAKARVTFSSQHMPQSHQFKTQSQSSKVQLKSHCPSGPSKGFNTHHTPLPGGPLTDPDLNDFEGFSTPGLTTNPGTPSHSYTHSFHGSCTPKLMSFSQQRLHQQGGTTPSQVSHLQS